MLKFHVLTPFSRPQNIAPICERINLPGVEWNPICHDPAHFQSLLGREWIKPMLVSPPPEWDPCYWKLNQWIYSEDHDPRDLYCFMNDDDGFEPEFFNRVRGAFESWQKPDVVFVSMSRGQHSPPRAIHRHPAGDILAVEGERMWNQMTILRGRLLPVLYYGNYSTADGDSTGALRRFRCRYEPTIFALFNLFEPGRWDSNHPLITSSETVRSY